MTGVHVERPVSDEGTIVIFEGRTDDDRLVSFGVDHRMAQGLVDAIDNSDGLYVELEGYQILHVGAVSVDV